MKNFLLATDRIIGKSWFLLIYAPIAFLFLFFFSYTTSPLSIAEGMDSAIFKTMGLMMTRGGVPYVDFFDHKGPILYFLNALGIFIGGRSGIFALQVLLLTFSIGVWHKIASLFVRPTMACLIAMLTLFMLIGLIEEGNQCEEWMLLPISLAFFLTSKWFVTKDEDSFPIWYSLAIGICFGIVFFIRPNDAVIQIGGLMTGIFLYIIIKQKNIKSAVLNAIFFFLGFVFVSIPIIGYFAWHNALHDLYIGLIGFNIGYSGGGHLNLLDKKSIGIMLPILLLICFVSLTDYKRLNWLFAPITLLAVILFGRALFPHYFITYVPIVFLSLILFVFLQKQLALKFLGIIILITFTPKKSDSFIYASVAKGLLPQSYLRHPHNSFIATMKETDSVFYQETEKLFAYIPTVERDSIWNYNMAWRFCDVSPYSSLLHSGIVQQNRIPPVIVDNLGDDTVGEEMRPYTDVSRYSPLWLVMVHYLKGQDFYAKDDSLYISANYSLVANTDSIVILNMVKKRAAEPFFSLKFDKVQCFEIQLYKRKD